MGTAKICIEGLSEKELELIDLKMREFIKSIRRINEMDIRIWREDTMSKEEI